MKFETIEKLKAFYQKNAVALGKKSSVSDIERTEKILKTVLNPDLKEFLLNFGGSLVGDKQIYGCKEGGNCEFMDEDVTLITLNSEFKVDFGKAIENLFIFGIDGSGNPIGILNEKVAIYYFDDDEIEVLSDSFEEYLLDSLNL